MFILVEKFKYFIADEFRIGLGLFGRDFLEVLDGGCLFDGFLLILMVDGGGGGLVQTGSGTVVGLVELM